MIVPKRVVVSDQDRFKFECELNELSDKGYTVEHYSVGTNGGAYIIYTAIAKLKTEADVDYKGMIDYMEVALDKVSGDMKLGTPLIEKAISEGWAVINIRNGTKDTPAMAVMARKKREMPLA